MLKLLLAVDGSECSNRAVDYLLAKMPSVLQSGELHLLNVQPPVPGGSRVGAVLGEERLKHHHQEEGLAALQPAMQKLQAAGVLFAHHIVVGEPGPMIAEFAREKGFDQIAMGTHGHGAPASLILGSVAMKVVHLSAVPVLLIK